MNTIGKLKNMVYKGQALNKEECIELYNSNLDELTRSADKIREDFCGDNVDLCSIINGKSGRCSENCKYCAQSIYFETNINEYPLMNYKDIENSALENQNEGVNRFSIVTAGKGLYGKDFDKVVDYYNLLNKNCSIKLCASHGIIDKNSLERLQGAGVKRYHHNLETSRRYYSEICTSHAYQDRIDTINYAKEIGMEVCSGGIIGMGESIEDRIDLGIILRDLDVKSIPVNALMPIKGTPLENQESILEEDILRTIAVFRFLNPNANIRLAAGRNLLTGFGEKALRSGANATITGNLLTTCGNKIADDKAMINKIGLRVR